MRTPSPWHWALVLSSLGPQVAWTQVVPSKALPSLVVVTQVAAGLSKRPVTQELLAKAVERAHAPSAEAFLSGIEACSAEIADRGVVTHQVSGQVFYLARSIAEVVFGKLLQENTQTALSAEYGEAARQTSQATRPPGAKPAERFIYQAEADLVLVREIAHEERICLKASERADEQLEILSHELVHYVQAARFEEELPDAFAYDGVREYGMRQALAPGSEVDAYILQLSLVAETRGLEQLAHASIRALFSAEGRFNGDRRRLAEAILDDLGYLKSHYIPEYRALIDYTRRANQARYQALLSLVNFRTSEEEHYRAEQASLAKDGSFEEAAKAQKLVDAAGDSRKRILGEIEVTARKKAELAAKAAGI